MDNKRETILAIMEQVEEWSDENGIAMSAMDQIELAERIYNKFAVLLADGEPIEPEGITVPHYAQA